MFGFSAQIEDHLSTPRIVYINILKHVEDVQYKSQMAKLSSSRKMGLHWLLPT